MSILPNHLRPSKAITHDPHVCGLSRDTSCPACRQAWRRDDTPNWEWDTMLRLGLRRYPQRLSKGRQQELLRWLADLVMSCRQDREYAREVRSLLLEALAYGKESAA